MKQKGFAPVIILIVIGLGLLAYFGFFYKGPPIIPPSSTPTPTPTTDPTANWKTYINPVDQFSFKYPGSWTIDLKGEKGDERKENISVSLTKDKAKINVYANMVGIGGSGMDYQGVPVQIDNNNLYKYKAENSYAGTTLIGITDRLTKSLGVFMIKDKTYSITLGYPISYNSQQAQELEKEFDLILSTFKFGGKADITSDWKQYTHPGIFYQVKYPSSWRLLESNLFVGFGPQEVQEDVLWGINIYGKADRSKESILAELGEQFSDKKQVTRSLEINGIKALEIITTTPSIPTWYSDTILIEYGTSYVTISNGAITDTELQKVKGIPPGTTFRDFYNTFRFMN